MFLAMHYSLKDLVLPFYPDLHQKLMGSVLSWDLHPTLMEIHSAVFLCNPADKATDPRTKVRRCLEGMHMTQVCKRWTVELLFNLELFIFSHSCSQHRIFTLDDCCLAWFKHITFPELKPMIMNSHCQLMKWSFGPCSSSQPWLLLVARFK